MEPIITQLAQELDQNPQYVANVVQLLDEGNTIPFIARYRKEHHGAMDDTTLRNLEERLQYLRGLQERREEYAGQAHRGARPGHRRRRHPGGGGGPVPPL